MGKILCHVKLFTLLCSIKLKQTTKTSDMKKQIIKATDNQGKTLYFQIMAGTRYLLTSIEYFAFTTFNKQMLEGRINEMKGQYPDHKFEICEL